MKKTFTKQFSTGKALSTDITTDVLSKINGYALQPLKAEELFVRKLILAHNCIDRDNERFPELLIDDFARTLPGKSALFFHEKHTLPLGLYFDTVTEDMTPARFKELTNEEARLPEGTTTVKVLWAFYYAVILPDNEYIRKNIDAGVFRHWSIGFRASDLNPIKNAAGIIQYWEYEAPGEATEGSLVYLGAQQGATSQKSADNPNQGGKEKMEKFLKAMQRCFPGKVFTEEGAQDELKAAMDDYVKTAVAAATGPLNDKIKELEALKPLATDGKAYRDELVDEYVRMKAALKEVAETTEAQDSVKAVAAGYPIVFLKTECANLQARMEKEFPGSQLKGDAKKDKSDEGKSDGKKKDNSLRPEKEG